MQIRNLAAVKLCSSSFCGVVKRTFARTNPTLLQRYTKKASRVQKKQPEEVDELVCV